ncbi:MULTISPECIES: hypothetical protein [unclassified Thioalkalivibrio]|uniref:hypothetical protein n=1 Tax=unclassified Thioalkalivibrio TaxID=2621013 RepID=UPI000371658B|nr:MULTISPECIES: hypothetical protein [unclassified Thioalkalivibrio]
MARPGGSIRLIARPGVPQASDAITLAPCGQRQDPGALVLREGFGGGPQSGGAVRLMPCLGGLPLGDAPGPDPAPDYPPPFRGPAPVVGMPYAGRHARRLRPHRAPGWTMPPPFPRHTDAQYQAGDPIRVSTAGLWGRLPPRPRDTAAPWPQALQERPRATEGAWGDVPPRREHTEAPWQNDLTARPVGTGLPFSEPPAKRPETEIEWGDTPLKIDTHHDLAHRGPPRLDAHDAIPWGATTHLTWGEHPEPEPPEPEPPEPEPPYTPPAGDAVHLTLRCPALDTPGDAIDLQLTETGDCPRPPYQPGSAITVQHTLSITRASDSAPVAVDRFTLQTDIDSWAWDFQAALRGPDAMDRVRPGAEGPQELSVEIDGQTWKILAERTDEDRTAGTRRRNVAGRGPAAILDAPYAPLRSKTQEAVISALQLAEQELQFTDWTLQWDAPDWTIPAGTWSYTDKTPIQAITTIAGAIGATVQAAPDTKTLHVRSRYPVSPWDWDTATPDTTIPGRLIRRASERWAESPPYNRAWVAGRTNGVLVSTTRNGTAGDAVAPQVVDDLITNVDAGRERGRVILAGAGRAIQITLEMPFAVAPDGPGLILPGMLVEVEDVAETYRALCVGASITAQGASVSHTVELERRIPA